VRLKTILLDLDRQLDGVLYESPDTQLKVPVLDGELLRIDPEELVKLHQEVQKARTDWTTVEGTLRSTYQWFLTENLVTPSTVQETSRNLTEMKGLLDRTHRTLQRMTEEFDW
jgi:hypothetical protein